MHHTALLHISLSLAVHTYIHVNMYIYVYKSSTNSAPHTPSVSLSTLPVRTKTANWPIPFSLCMTHGV